MYLIHWTSTRPADLDAHHILGRRADAITSATRVESEAELLGWLLALPGDGTVIVRAVTEQAAQVEATEPADVEPAEEVSAQDRMSNAYLDARAELSAEQAREFDGRLIDALLWDADPSRVEHAIRLAHLGTLGAGA